MSHGSSLLVGLPGIRKSRLVWGSSSSRLIAGAGMIFWPQGCSSPTETGSPPGSRRKPSKRDRRIPRDRNPAATVGTKLRIAVEDVVSEASEALWVAEHLAPLAGLAPTHELRGDRRTEAFAGLAAVLRGNRRTTSIVLVFEDLHWADDDLLEFVSALLGSVSGALCWSWRPAVRNSWNGKDGLGAGRVGSTKVLSSSRSPTTKDPLGLSRTCSTRRRSRKSRVGFACGSRREPADAEE